MPSPPKVSDEQIIEALKTHTTKKDAAAFLGIHRGQLARRIKALDGKAEIPPYAFVPTEDHFRSAHHEEDDADDVINMRNAGTVQRFILTSAQNNCEAHPGFLRNLKALASNLDAELLISFVVYDKTHYSGFQRIKKGEAKSKEIWWDKAVEPFAVNDRVKLAEKLAFCAELDPLATSPNPLSGMDAYCGRSSVIVPHNRFQHRCVASRRGDMAKELYTTGSVTKRRFIRRPTGSKAQFHHVLGALLIEIDEDGYFWTHHLHADRGTGNFYWLDKHVSDGRVRKNRDGIAACVLGDIHAEKVDDEVLKVSLDMLAHLKPKHTFVHDLIDFTTRNHHNRESPRHAIKNANTHRTVEDDLFQGASILQRIQDTVQKHGRVYVVRSNHDTAFERWIQETHWQHQGPDALFKVRADLAFVWAMHDGPSFKGGMLEWAIRQYFGMCPDVVFLALDESFEINGVEFGIHGHVGANGAFGSPKLFAKLGFRSVTAHTHQSSINDGCYTVGLIGKLQMGYNVGCSSWNHCNLIQYANGKRAFSQIKNGKWRP